MAENMDIAEKIYNAREKFYNEKVREISYLVLDIGSYNKLQPHPKKVGEPKHQFNGYKIAVIYDDEETVEFV